MAQCKDGSVHRRHLWKAELSLALKSETDLPGVANNPAMCTT